MKVISIFKNPIQLVKHAAANDRKAQQALYKAYAPKMLAVCRSYISDVHHAEEVMMNGFLKVFSNMNDFEKIVNFNGIFYHPYFCVNKQNIKKLDSEAVCVSKIKISIFERT